MEFIDREPELEQLAKLWETGTFQFIPITGRRSVGKTRLMREFFEGKRHVYFYVQEGRSPDILSLFTATVENGLGIRLARGSGWREVLEAVFKAAEKERLIFVIDEFQRLEAVYPGFTSLLQSVIDENKDRTKVFMVAMGSAIGMLEQMFAGSAPLYNRQTGRMRLGPLDLRSSSMFMKQRSREEQFTIYSAFGGVPRYLEEVSKRPGLKFEELAKELVASPASPFFEEPKLIFGGYNRASSAYFSILAAISKGKRTLKEISDVAGVPHSEIDPYLKVMTSEMFILRKDMPLLSDNGVGKITRYRFDDKMLQFWFRFVFPVLSELSLGINGPFIESCKADIKQISSRVAEEEVLLHLVREGENKKMPIGFDRIGQWWNRQGDEIDVIGIEEKTKSALFCECKWTDGPIDPSVLETLKKKAELFPWNAGRRKDIFAVFSKSGFKGNWPKDVLRYTLDDLFE